jgi:hypothetical protein
LVAPAGLLDDGDIEGVDEVTVTVFAEPQPASSAATATTAAAGGPTFVIASSS